jgi:hypothetical protein
MALVATLLMCVPTASAQTSTQLWGNLTFNWVKSDRLVYELDFEPKALLDAPEGEPDWRNLDVTPNVEYSLRPWLDLVADTTIGRTMQSDDLDSTEVTPRLGVRFHLFSRAQKLRVREPAPRRRPSSATSCASSRVTSSTPAVTWSPTRRSASGTAWNS